MASESLNRQQQEPNEKAESRELERTLLPAKTENSSGYVANITVDHSSPKADSASQFTNLLGTIAALVEPLNPFLEIRGCRRPLTFRQMCHQIRAEA